MPSFIKKCSVLDWAIIAIFAAGLFLSLWNLGESAFLDYDEAQYAQVASEGIMRGDFNSFTLFGTPWFDKPPLLFWLVFGSIKVFGLNEFAMRLPSALMAFGSLVLTYLIALNIFKKKSAAALASFILLTMPLFWEAGRQLRFDVPVAFFIFLGLWCFLKGKSSPQWNLGIGISAALGFLSKSIIGFFIFPIILIFNILEKDFRWLKKSQTYYGAMLGLIVLAPWHIYESVKFGHQFWDVYLFRHVFQRFSENILGGTSSNVLYFKHLLEYMEPWFLVTVLCAAVSIFWVKEWKKMRAEWALLVSLVFMFVIFCLCQTKLLYYLVPTYPLMALYLAGMLMSIFEKVKAYRLKEMPAVSFSGLFASMFALASLGALIHAPLIVFHLTDNALSEIQYSANEEREAGKIADAPIYADNYLYWDTLKYYSKKQVAVFDPNAALPKPYYLITAERGGKEVYAGRYIRMVKVE